VIRLAKGLFEAVQLLLPAFDLGLDVGADAVVRALCDLGGVDLRRCRLGWLRRRRYWLLALRRGALCNGPTVNETAPRKNEARND
jgi:hypothetical protein